MNQENLLVDPRFDGNSLKLAYNRLFILRHWRDVQQTFGLTNREIQVGILICKGNSNQKIAKDLGIRLSTTKEYIKRIQKKLNVHSKTQLAVKMILATDIFTEEA